MSKGNILGTRPETDPFEESPGSHFSVTSNVELKWDNRKQRIPLALPLFLLIISVAFGLYYPIL
ncbi:MAG: hypothetical protein KAR03_11050, partial [Candidatus Thorarchaeota archaeon]|nr:hypothetical protein [Candidatus Thorarchaeota archaeon]